MKQHSDKFYHYLIRKTFPNVQNIRKPKIIGGFAPVFVATINNQDIVCKFNSKDLIIHNKYISTLLHMHRISVPQTTVHNIKNYWFETYPYNPSKTLHELIQNGLSKEHIYTAYKNILEIQNQLLQLNIKTIKMPTCPYYIDVINTQLQANTNPSIAYLKRTLYSLGQYGEQHICHNDIQPKNILYSPETQTSYLIDLDAVSICNKNISLINLLRNYPLDNTNELLNFYGEITGVPVNKTLLKTTSKLLNIPNIIYSKIHRNR